MANYRCFIWLVPFLTFITQAQAVQMDEECINEPVFNGRVCVYQTNRAASQNIFLIHGIGDNASRDWERQLAMLAEQFHIITIDLAGFGRSEQGDKPYTPENYAALIDFVASHYTIQRFDLIGHSMGASVAMLYAAKFPQNVKRLVLVDAAGILHRIAIGKYVIASGINSEADGTDKVESYVVKIIEKFEGLFSLFSDDVAKESEHARAGIELVDYDFGQTLDKIITPTLIIWGAEDQIAPLRTAKVLNYRIKNSQLNVIPDAGHLPMKEKSETFNHLLDGFLNSAGVAAVIANNEKEMRNTIGTCNGKSGVRFHGEYQRIEINNCNDVVLEGVSVTELSVFESRVVIENSHIGGEVAVALDATGSDLKITASRISGEVAIKVDRSRLDLAAVDLQVKEKAIVANSRSRFIFSVSRIYRGQEKTNIHDYVTLNQGGTL
ncbi:MAG: alpha/beta hydrolase [Gammaproteobacteria bacterium]|nr:alpha/beta hydrolase [Gammaproteobacteria bacterium]